MIRALVLVLAAACAAKQPAPQEPIGNTGGNTSMQPVEQTRPSPSGGDRDGDGVADNADMCPDDPEDFDAFSDADGCPDPDNDSDGILDIDDLCPNEPEPKDGKQDDDGCPP